MQDEYAGGTSLEALEALVRARMERDPSLGGDLLDTGIHGLPALAAEPVMLSSEDLAPGASAAAVPVGSPQRLWMDLASPSGPVPMSLAGFLPGSHAALSRRCPTAFERQLSPSTAAAIQKFEGCLFPACLRKVAFCVRGAGAICGLPV